MTQKKIKHAQFQYHVPVKMADPETGKTKERLSPRIARRDQWVDIPRDEDIERGEQAGAFFTDEELNPTTTDDDDIVDDADADEDDEEDAVPSHDELVLWMRSKKPTIATVVARADSPQMARALMEAENEASGGDPRTTLIARLDRIANQDV